MRPGKVMVLSVLSLLVVTVLKTSRAIEDTPESLHTKPGGCIYEQMEKIPDYSFKVLIAGYEPWEEMASNPAQKVAILLNETCERVYLRNGVASFTVCYEGWALPVTEEGASEVSKALKENPFRWDAILHLGIWSALKKVHLEVAAANIKANNIAKTSSEVPCNKDGTEFEDIVPGGPCLLPTTAGLQYLDLADLSILLRNHGIKNADDMVTWSRDAGAFFCNEALYRTLHQIRSRAPAVLTPALFVHLPEEHILHVDISKHVVSYIVQSVLVALVGLV